VERQQEKSTEKRGGAREGSGPKPLKVSERRRRTAIVRLTDGEKLALKRAARQEKALLSEWMRQILLAEASTA
jgi:hypothetical protein